MSLKLVKLPPKNSGTAATLALRGQVIDWMAQYLEGSQRQGFVLGMSGGVDSATLAMLARDAAEKCGREFLALVLPIDSADMDEFQATNQCRRFGIRLEVARLTSTFSTMKGGLPGTRRAVTDTNLKARLRESALYYYSNIGDYLVLGTVNAGEYAIGYFPKHGAAGDLMPMATLLKREIRDIARSYNLPDDIVLAKASGCIHGRTAEEEWGFSEDELDEFALAIEHGEDAVWSLQGIPRDKTERFLTMHRAAQHKRAAFPIFQRTCGR